MQIIDKLAKLSTSWPLDVTASLSCHILAQCSPASCSLLTISPSPQPALATLDWGDSNRSLCSHRGGIMCPDIPLYPQCQSGVTPPPSCSSLMGSVRAAPPALTQPVHNGCMLAWLAASCSTLHRLQIIASFYLSIWPVGGR